MKLWKKGYELNKTIEQFTVGNDYLLDMRLLSFDCLASQAHAKMLHKIGVLDIAELGKLLEGLKTITFLAEENKFVIKPEDEDCHTAIEKYLTENYGEIGKKIHTARSRNDQVLTALRLYEKHELMEVKELLLDYKTALTQLINKKGHIVMPGYTHMQKAMPTTAAMWLECFVDSVTDLNDMLDATLKLIDQSPLGSAAGFGVPVFNNDKEMTATEMGFSKVMQNPIYCQMSRSKFEVAILHLLSQIMFDLNKLATDLIMYSMDEFGYISLSQEFCTGSSIMPQKKNPDVLELVRAKYHDVLAEEFKIKSLVANLISGYNRDIQITKESLFNGIDIAKSCLNVMTLVLKGIHFNQEKIAAAVTSELYATEEAYKLVQQGVPFRQAYQIIGVRYTANPRK